MYHSVLKFVSVLCLMFLNIIFIYSQENANCNQFEELTSANAANIELIAEWQNVENRSSVGTFSPNGEQIAIADGNDTLTLFNIEDFEIENSFSLSNLQPEMISFDETGQYLRVFSERNTNYQIWDLTTGVLVNQQSFEAVLWSDLDATQNTLAVLSQNSDLTMFDPTTGELRFEIPNVDFIPLPKLSSDGERVLFTNLDGLVEMWDTNTGERIMVLESPLTSADINGYGFQSGSDVIWSSWSNWSISNQNAFESTIEFRDIVTGNVINTLGEDGNIYYDIFFDDESNLLAISGDLFGMTNTIWFYDYEEDVQLGDEIATPGGGQVAFSPSSELAIVISGTDPSGYVYALNPVNLLASLDIGSGSLSPAKLSPNGDLIMTEGLAIQLWGIPSEAVC